MLGLWKENTNEMGSGELSNPVPPFEDGFASQNHTLDILFDPLTKGAP